MHTSSSLHSSATPAQVSSGQVSTSVHMSPSSHGAAFGVATLPILASHASSVHTSSSQFFGAPVHAPAEQTSLSVHRSPSSHGASLLVNPHTPAMHTGLVQTFASSGHSASTLQPPSSPLTRLSIPNEPPVVVPAFGWAGRRARRSQREIHGCAGVAGPDLAHGSGAGGADFRRGRVRSRWRASGRSGKLAGMQLRTTSPILAVGDAGELPGGDKKVADELQSGHALCRRKFVEPGEDLGMAFDGLVHIDGRWWALGGE